MPPKALYLSLNNAQQAPRKHEEIFTFSNSSYNLLPGDKGTAKYYRPTTILPRCLQWFCADNWPKRKSLSLSLEHRRYSARHFKFMFGQLPMRYKRQPAGCFRHAEYHFTTTGQSYNYTTNHKKRHLLWR